MAQTASSSGNSATHRQVVSVRQPHDAGARNRVVEFSLRHIEVSRALSFCKFHFVKRRRAIKARRD